MCTTPWLHTVCKWRLLCWSSWSWIWIWTWIRIWTWSCVSWPRNRRPTCEIRWQLATVKIDWIYINNISHYMSLCTQAPGPYRPLCRARKTHWKSIFADYEGCTLDMVVGSDTGVDSHTLRYGQHTHTHTRTNDDKGTHANTNTCKHTHVRTRACTRTHTHTRARAYIVIVHYIT